MIDSVLKVLKEDVGTFLNLKMNTSGSEDKISLAPVVNEKGDAAEIENSVAMSLVKIEEERENMAYVKTSQVVENNKVCYHNPPVKINLYILFTAFFNDYTESLKFISYIISFFQTKRVFTSSNTPGLAPEAGKITLEIYNQPLQDDNYLWGMLGTSYRPSVLYKLKMLTIQERQITAQGALVEEIDHMQRAP